MLRAKAVVEAKINMMKLCLQELACKTVGGKYNQSSKIPLYTRSDNPALHSFGSLCLPNIAHLIIRSLL